MPRIDAHQLRDQVGTIHQAIDGELEARILVIDEPSLVRFET